MTTEPFALWSSPRTKHECFGYCAAITATIRLKKARPLLLSRGRLRPISTATLMRSRMSKPPPPARRSSVKYGKALRAIPAGTTISYGQLAANLGRKGASRAVGAANGANPIPIVVPCHRVIGADGSLTGFGSGLPRKQWLLDHERRFAPVVVGG